RGHRDHLRRPGAPVRMVGSGYPRQRGRVEHPDQPGSRHRHDGGGEPVRGPARVDGQRVPRLPVRRPGGSGRTGAHPGRGRRGPGLAASAGVASGMVVNTVMAMIGLGAALAASKTLYTIVKLIGAAYLVYLGVMALWSLRAKRSGSAPAEASGTTEAPEPALSESRLWPAYRRGFFANFLNPKVVVFLVTLMPQFLPKRPTVEEQVLLGIVTVVMVLLWFSTVALLVSLLRKAFQRP